MPNPAQGPRPGRRPSFVFPRGSDGPTFAGVDEACSFVIFIDSEVSRDLLDLPGPGGPGDFDAPVDSIMINARKVIVSIGRPSQVTRIVMKSVESDDGYSVIVETSAARAALWSNEAIALRGGANGLGVVGPRKDLPPELHERLLVDTDGVEPDGHMPPPATLH